MKTNTYRWIIGCLLGAIIVLMAYLLAKENGFITVSFSDSLSFAATLSSIVLSVIAMFYTYYSGRDATNIYNQITSAIREIESKVQIVSQAAKTNAETLRKMKDAVSEVEAAIRSTSQALETLQKDSMTAQEKEVAIENMENTKNSMMMFLNKMR